MSGTCSPASGSTDGEIQIIPDNDSALNVDESAGSPLWRAIDPSGKLVAPGSSGIRYKYDGVNPGISIDAADLVPGGVRPLHRGYGTSSTRGLIRAATIIMPGR